MPRHRSEGPQRSCVVCREKSPPDDLVRLTVDPSGSAVVDFRGKLGGRGAWCHPRCLDELEKQPRRLDRSLKQRSNPGPFRAQYEAALHRALADGLSMAAASGALVGGRVVLSQAIANGEVVEVLLASDASERTVRDLRSGAADELPFTTLEFLTTAELGARVGKGMRAAVGVRHSRSAAHLLRQLRALRGLG